VREQVKPGTPEQADFDVQLLELFRSELDTNSCRLEAVTGTKCESASELDAAVRAAHSIRGAARIAGLKPLALLAESLETRFSELQRAKASLSEEAARTINSAVNLFRSLSSLEPVRLAAEVTDKAEQIKQLAEDVSKSAGSAGILPASSAATSDLADGTSRQDACAPRASTTQFACDPVMLDLFKTELTNHTRTLEAGLVGLEQEQTSQKIEPLMRAAHSVKGAARIVGLDNLVRLAHAMEDLLSSAQRGKTTLSSRSIDLLLAGNDVFRSVAGAQLSAIPGLISNRLADIQQLTERLAGANDGAAAVPEAEKTGEMTAAPGTPLPAVPEPEQTGESLVRVLAENLNRLMGLTGEALIQAKATRVFSGNWAKLKGWERELGSALEGLYDWAAREEDISEDVRALVIQSVTRLGQISDLARKNLEQFELFSARLEQLTDRLYAEVLATRMRPFSEGVFAFPRMVRDLARDSGKRVRFETIGEATRVDRDILEKLEAPLTHLLRNAIDHGVESPEERAAAGKPAEGVITLEARHASGLLHVSVKDDGRGIDAERLRQKVVQKGYVPPQVAATLTGPELLEFLFLPGFSTADVVTETSGRGVGLDVVQSMAKEVGGSVQMDSTPGKGTVFHLRLPLTLSVTRTLVVDIASEYYALPLTRIDRIIAIPREEVQVVEERQFYNVDGENIGLLEAAQVMHLPESGREESKVHVVVISDRFNRYGLVVNRFVGEKDLVVLQLDPRLGRVPNISAAAILEDGVPALILDVDDLVRSIDNLLTYKRPNRIGEAAAEAEEAGKRILVVDDSLTVREVERRLLENSGYEVMVAVDGMDGWNLLQTSRFDLVISDVDMPRMDGIELVKRIKGSPQWKGLPVMIVSYKDRDEDKKRGLEAGANYYLTKSSFHDESLINAVQDLIGTGG
jgi:two-component system sensor histidine kinase and response regulator WspE